MPAVAWFQVYFINGVEHINVIDEFIHQERITTDQLIEVCRLKKAKYKVITTFGDPAAIFGTSTYSGESLQSIFDTQTQGSGFTVSLQFESSGTGPPFSLDAAVIEYGQYGRR